MKWRLSFVTIAAVVGVGSIQAWTPLTVVRSSTPRHCGATSPHCTTKPADDLLVLRATSDRAASSDDLRNTHVNDEDISQLTVVRKGGAQALRSAQLTNAQGEKVRLGDYMGQGTSIVVFLRHLG